MTSPETPSDFDITPVSIEGEMKRSYLDYAMSVIVSRALPDARDGLKPVHRRILFAMKEGGYEYNKPFRKSARIVGDVMGKYHPHGDSAIYDAMVRMAQDFSMRLPLIDGQGNFGSMDGDRAAAMRYTEARMARSAHVLIEDIDKDTVNFQPNYDETVSEPSVLPARYPNLLVNGAGGIAVGMATNIPPHNLGEVIDACLAYVENPDITIDEMIEKYVQGPDFPTGGIILGKTGINSAFHTGRGSVVIRGKTEIEEIRKDRFAIIITEVPYQVNKARMVEIIAETVRDKRIEGISDLRDESDRDGVRVVVEIKRDHMPEVVLNQLFKFTPLQTSFGTNMLALNEGKPEQMNLKQMIAAFVKFREEVITRRTAFELNKARDKAHVLAGLAVAVANIDEIIELIRRASDPATAREQLMAKAWPAGEVAPLIALIDEPEHKVVDGTYNLSETQAKAILDLRLHRLTGLERDKIAGDLREIGDVIEELLSILRSREKMLKVLTDELQEMRDQFATERRTQLHDAEFEHDIEDLIQREDMIVTVSSTGYIKRVPLTTYRAQRRGGKGRTGMSTKEEDVVDQVFVANTHTPVLFFSSKGMSYVLKVYRLPLGSPTSKGKAMVNLLPLEQGETISTVMPMPEDEATWDDLHVIFTTKKGSVRRNRLSDFSNIRVNGKIAMKFEGADADDALVRVRTVTEEDDVLLSAKSGKCIRFPVSALRVFNSRTSTGVRGIRLAENDEVIGMSALRGAKIDSETREAYMKAVAASRRLSTADYTGKDDEKTKDEGLASQLEQQPFAEMVENEEFILTITVNGYGKRTSAYEYRAMGRGAQGFANIVTSERNGDVIASFPVHIDDQLVMVTDGGKLIRCPIHDIRVAGRNTQGVTIFKTADDEKVVSVTRIRDMADDEEEIDGEEGATVVEGNEEGASEEKAKEVVSSEDE